MNDLFRAIAFDDDVMPVFEALSEWCKQHKVSPDSLEGCCAACHLFDLFQNGYTSEQALLTELNALLSGISDEKAA